MPKFHIQEADFHLPDFLKDKTVNIFTLHDGGASEVSLVITRDPVKPGIDLQRYTRRMLVEMEERLANFELVSQGTLTLDERPATQVDCRWVSEGVELYQRQIACLYPAASGVGMIALLITSTARTWTADWEGHFAEVLLSFRFRSR